MSQIRNGEGTRLIKAEMARQGVSYDGLVAALARLGVTETNQGLRNKFSRETVSADLLLHCLRAMGVTKIHLD